MSQLKSKKYILADDVKSVVPPVLGKRPADQAKPKPAKPALKKREVKEESKDVPA